MIVLLFLQEDRMRLNIPLGDDLRELSSPIS